MTSKKIIN